MRALPPPLLQDRVPLDPEDAPLSEGALLLIGWFAGTLPLAGVLWFDAVRLADEGARRDALIIGLGSVGLAFAMSAGAVDLLEESAWRQGLRWAEKLACLAAWALFTRRTLGARRRWLQRTDADFRSPWTVGLLAVLVGGTVWGVARALALVFLVLPEGLP